jgi:hypothetical protein
MPPRNPLPLTSSTAKSTRRARGLLAVVVGAVVMVLLVVVVTAIAGGRETDPTAELSKGPSRFVSPTGSASGDGSQERPFDLASALSGKGQIAPGTTVWLRGGVYGGTFRSDLQGTEQQPIVVRSFPGEHATIDSAPATKPALSVYGSWTTYRDFEIRSSGWLRESAVQGASEPADLQRGPGVEVHGPNTKFVNLVVHDLTDGFGLWSDAENAEAYGNIVYHNGWHSGNRNNGHGIYTQNKVGKRLIAENIIFNQFAAGIHAYGTDSAFLDDILLEGNVSFNNGLLGKRYDRNILLGGATRAHRPTLQDNHTYFTSGRGLSSGQNNIGYLAGCADLALRRNFFVAGELGFAVELVNCTGSVTDNTFFGELRGVEEKTLINHPVIKQRFPANTYLDQAPTSAQVFVRSNRYEAGRAHIIVYNWDKREEVTVDVSAAMLPPGAPFEVRDAQNYLGAPVVTGVYRGRPITIPLTGLTVAAPTGQVLHAPEHTAPSFAVFVLTPSRSTSFLQKMTAAVVRAF